MYQFCVHQVHLERHPVDGVVSMGVSALSDSLSSVSLPSQWPEAVLRCPQPELVRSRLKQDSLMKARFNAYQSARQETARDIFIPTLIQERASRDTPCAGREATQEGPGRPCEFEREKPVTYRELYDDPGMFNWDKTSVVLDVDRIIFTINHDATVSRKGLHMERNAISGYVKYPNGTRMGLDYGNATKAAMVAGRPYRKVQDDIDMDYIPLKVVMELAGVTSECAQNKTREYLPLLSGYTIILSIDYSTSAFVFPWQRRKPEYTYSARIASRRMFAYEEEVDFERTRARTTKKFGIRIQTTSGGEVKEFSIIYITQFVLPEVVALLAIVNVVVYAFLVYGHWCYGIRAFAKMCWCVCCCLNTPLKDGAPGIWYYKYIFQESVDLAALDYYLRFKMEPHEKDDEEGHQDREDIEAFPGIGRRCNASYWKPLSEHEMHTKLSQFYETYVNEDSKDQYLDVEEDRDSREVFRSDSRSNSE